MKTVSKFQRMVTAISDGYTPQQAELISSAKPSLHPWLRKLFDGERIMPNRVAGSGKYIHNVVLTDSIVEILVGANFKYMTGNDAPRGGLWGIWICLIKDDNGDHSRVTNPSMPVMEPVSI